MARFSWRRSVTAVAFLAALALAGRPACAEEGTAEQRIEEALLQTITPKVFVDTPLYKVITELAAELKIPIEFDHKAMADGMSTPEAPITINLANVSVESALALILEPLDLTVVIKHEVLLVTTESEAESSTSIKVYPVGDLLAEPDSLNPERDYDSLIEVIATTVGSTSWNQAGGPGVIQESHFARALVVSQTRAVHREIRDLLADLRRAALLAAGRPAPPGPSTAEQRIEEALTQTIVPMEFVGTPLTEVMSRLAAELKIPIHFDKKAMADGIATADTMVGMSVADVSVESALALILEPLDLTVVIKHEVLLVTTTTEAESVMSAEVYPVGDLLFSENARDYEDLIELITTTVAPTSWSESGPSPVTEYDVARALVVPQTRDIHRQIRDLLAQLRSVVSAGPLEPIVAAEPVVDDGQMFVRVYRVDIPRTGGFGGGFSGSGGMGAGRMGGSGMGGAFSVRQMSATSTQPDPSNANQPSSDDIVAQQAVIDKRASELAAAIPAFVEPETWESAGGTGRIQAAAGALIVRQTRRVHALIMEFLFSF